MTDSRDIYCKCSENACDCGRRNFQIALCPLPLSGERVASVFKKLREQQSEAQQ